MLNRILIASAALILTGAAADAEIRFTFLESAPKDRFLIENMSACATGPIEVVIDLSTSEAGLIFDTSGSGAGVQVFQPFEFVAGADQVLSVSEVTDGDAIVRLSLSTLPAGAAVAFTVDVDDQLTSGALGQSRVAGSEIAGASASVLSGEDAPRTGIYDDRGEAAAAFDACLQRQSGGVFHIPQRKT